jgi:hypothetical protein
MAEKEEKETKTLKGDYSKLKKENPDLPELKNFLVAFGFPSEDDRKDLFKLMGFVRKSTVGLAEAFMMLISPQEFISAQDNKFVKDMKDELMDNFKKVLVIHKGFSLSFMEAAKSSDPEAVLSKAVNEVSKELAKHASVYEKALRISKKGWEESKNGEECEAYHG